MGHLRPFNQLPWDPAPSPALALGPGCPPGQMTPHPGSLGPAASHPVTQPCPPAPGILGLCIQPCQDAVPLISAWQPPHQARPDKRSGQGPITSTIMPILFDSPQQRAHEAHIEGPRACSCKGYLLLNVTSPRSDNVTNLPNIDTNNKIRPKEATEECATNEGTRQNSRRTKQD